jgi:hypothetical protein
MRNDPGAISNQSAEAELACGSKEFDLPFPVSPPGESRGGLE